MDGIPALDLLDLVMDVFHSSPNQFNNTKDVREPRGNFSATLQSNMRKRIPTTNTNLDLINIHHVPSNGTHSGSNAMLHVFEDNEAVIEMIIKGRSPTMRHVSRTHRVALDWLFDRINLDSTIHIRYIDTKQLADILTKGNFTRDEWNNLLHLFKISHFSSICCVKCSSLTSCSKTMAKRMQERKGERSVGKSKSTAMNLSSHAPTSSSSAKSPKLAGNSIASKSPGILIATVKLERRKRRNSKSDAQRRVLKRDCKMHTLAGWWTQPRILVATKEESGDLELSESETGSEKYGTGRLVAQKTATVKPYASSKSDSQGGPKAERIEWSHNLHVSPATIHHTEAVFSIVWVIYGREHDDPVDDLDVNMAIWCIFLNATLWAAVHLGQDYEAKLRYVKNQFWNSVGQLFNETGKLISERKEITDVSTIGFKDATWMSTRLLCEKAYQITNAKTYVFSASVLCVGKMGDDPVATWKSKIEWYSENNHFKDMNRIDGMPTEFECKIFRGITTLGLLEKIQKSNERPTVWTWALHRQDHLHVYVQRLNDIANWRTKRQSTYTKFQVHAWMIINSNKKNLNQSENYHKSAHKLFWNACTWHESEDQTFYGLSTNLQEQSRNGLRHVTDDWQDWFRGFISRLRLCWRPWGSQNQTGGNLMYLWESNIRLHLLDVQETHVSISQFNRIRNCFVGCWFENGRAICSWFMGCGGRSVTFIEEYRITNPSGSRKLLAKSQIQTQTRGKPRCWSNVACGLRHRTSLKTMRQWSKWSSKAEVQPWDMYPEPTGVALDWFFDRFNLNSQNSNQVCRHQTPTCRLVAKREFRTWWVEQSSSSV